MSIIQGTGKRLKQPDGKPVLKCWFPPEGSDNNSGQPVQVPADEVVVKRVAGEGKVHPKVHPQMNGDSSESQAKQPKVNLARHKQRVLPINPHINFMNSRRMVSSPRIRDLF